MPGSFDQFNRIARSGRLGQPVFLRLQVTCPPERAVAALAEALAAAVSLFEQTPISLRACGDEPAGAIQVVLSFSTGASILAYTGPGEEAVDGLLLGNRGAAAGHVPVAWPWRDGSDVAPGSAAPPAPLEAAIRHSLAHRQPVPLAASRSG